MADNNQQITFPLDPISTQILQKDLPVAQGTGTFGTQSVSVVAGAVTVPAQPSGTVKVRINGKLYELLVK